MALRGVPGQMTGAQYYTLIDALKLTIFIGSWYCTVEIPYWGMASQMAVLCVQEVVYPSSYFIAMVDERLMTRIVDDFYLTGFMRPFISILSMWIVLLISACGGEVEQVKAVPPAVSVYIVESEEIGQYLEFIARTEAFQTAEIRARVEGELLIRGFVEGSSVEKGQLLFQIDAAEYVASLNQVKSDLVSKNAGAGNAARSLGRGKEL